MRSGELAQVLFRTQGEAMTQASRLAEAGLLERPYVSLKRYGNPTSAKVWMVGERPTSTVDRARRAMALRKG